MLPTSLRPENSRNGRCTARGINSPSFTLLGQVLSTRPDLVGSELAMELTELQANNPADAPEVLRQLLQDELQRPIENAFADFNEVPLASASIAQVHQATLLTGEQVIIKVQHDAIEERVRNDLDILTLLAGLAEQVSPGTRQYQTQKTAEEFGRTLMRELDFTLEAGNLQRFSHDFADQKHIHFPCVHEESTSLPRRVTAGSLRLPCSRVSGPQARTRSKAFWQH